MKKGHLSQYFTGVASKRLREVEVNPRVSHQHEFNGTEGLKRLLGTNSSGDKKVFPARSLWMSEENETLSVSSPLSWYDSRFKKPDRSPEYRLYFQTNDVMEKARPGDLLIIGRRPDNTLTLIIAPAGTTVENQLLWLFGIPDQEGRLFTYEEYQGEKDTAIGFAAGFILEELGIEVEAPEADRLNALLEPLMGVMPPTREFSKLARRHASGADPLKDPDRTLLIWMEFEEQLFRQMEKQLVDERIRQGFMNGKETDVDGFIQFSLSVQNRRKARAGRALENHLEALFQTHSIRFSQGVVTENKARPDFLFPAAEAYHKMDFPADRLTMLGAKTSCKDRWRQVLSEAERIPNKHLLTLEPGISKHQTDEMQARQLQLILPSSLHSTFTDVQKSWLMNVQQFIELVKERQKA